MKVETMGRVLIAIGALVMLYAQLAMPISLRGSDIVNIHLISERQNILMLGGLFFIAGIVLFAVFKMKQTKEEGDLEIKQQQEQVDKAKVVLKSTSEGALNVTKSMLGRLESGKLSIATRLIAGLVCGAICGFHYTLGTIKLVSLVTDYSMETGGLIATGIATVALVLAYAILGTGTQKTVIRLVVLTVITIFVSQTFHWNAMSDI